MWVLCSWGHWEPHLSAFLHFWIQVTGDVWQPRCLGSPHFHPPLIMSLHSCTYQCVFEPIIAKETQEPGFSLWPPDSSVPIKLLPCLFAMKGIFPLHPPFFSPFLSWHLFLSRLKSSFLFSPCWVCCIFCLAIWTCLLVWVQIALLDHPSNHIPFPGSLSENSIKLQPLYLLSIQHNWLVRSTSP